MTVGRRTLVGAVLAVALVGLVAALVLSGAGWLNPSRSSTHPPCEQLPSANAVDAALRDHADLSRAITDVSPDVHVSVGRPCAGLDDAALVQVSFRTSEQRHAIEDVLSRTEGFGVPVHLVKG